VTGAVSEKVVERYIEEIEHEAGCRASPSTPVGRGTRPRRLGCLDLIVEIFFEHKLIYRI
jgi:hypothetical protein